MEIAAYPVPYLVPALPQIAQARPARGPDSGLPSRQGRTNTPEERVLQGEVINNTRGQSGNESTSSRYTFEQQARRARPDLSALDASSRLAIQSYLDHDELMSQIRNSRSLIDEYV
jgi:hypothetical protein